MNNKGWVCVCRLGGVGDNLVAASPLRPLKRMGYMVEVLTSEMCASVFYNNPHVDKLSVKKEGEIPGGEDWQRWFATKAGEYDLLVNLSNSMETLHASHRANTMFWWPQDFRRKHCGGSYLESAHDIVGVPYDFGPLFFPTEEERSKAEKVRDEVIGGPYIAWVISGSRLDKVYPYTTHAIPRVIAELNIPVVLVGVGGKQFEMAKQVQDEVRRSLSNAEKNLHLALSPDFAEPGGAQHWSIRRSLTQAITADLVVSPDTGVAWASAMEPIAKLIMVSHASANNITKHWVNTITLSADPYRVPCHPCHRLHDDMSTCRPAADNPNAAACMADIKVADVMESIDKLWKKRNNVVRLEAA